MYKCQIRLQIIREKEKLDELRLYKLFDDVTRTQQKKHIKIIKEKIRKLEEELRRQDE